MYSGTGTQNHDGTTLITMVGIYQQLQMLVNAGTQSHDGTILITVASIY
jgi:hypothetical protein